MLSFLAEAGNPVEHVLPHHLFWIGGLDISNQILMAVIAGILMLLIFPLAFRNPGPTAPKGARNFLEAMLEFLRVEVFRPALKEHTDRFAPFLWTQFFFILLCGLLGFIPFTEIFRVVSGGTFHKHVGATATGSISVTAALAIIVFVVIHVEGVLQVFRDLKAGTYGHHAPHNEHTSNGSSSHEAAMDLDHMRGEGLAADVPFNFKAMADPTGHYHDDQSGRFPRAISEVATHGPGVNAVAAALLAIPLYLWNFAPHPFRPEAGGSALSWIADIPMWLLLLVLELIGALIKPFALAIRLFANMIGGHIVLAVLATLIVGGGGLLGQLGVGIPMTALSLLIRALELFVIFLQAFIFTFLSTLFIASAVAPEH